MYKPQEQTTAVTSHSIYYDCVTPQPTAQELTQRLALVVTPPADYTTLRLHPVHIPLPFLSASEWS